MFIRFDGLSYTIYIYTITDDRERFFDVPTDSSRFVSQASAVSHVQIQKYCMFLCNFGKIFDLTYRRYFDSCHCHIYLVIGIGIDRI